MNKIANWVFGSFFRTIGRLLVFILLGVIIAHFIDFGSLKDNFSITDLFFDKVSAASVVSSYYQNNYYKSNGSAYSNSNNGVPDSQRIGLALDTTTKTYVYFNNSGSEATGMLLGSNNTFNEIIFQVGFAELSDVAKVNRSISATLTWAKNNQYYATTICNFNGAIDMNFNSTNANMVYYNMNCYIPSNNTSDNLYLSKITFGSFEGSTFEYIDLSKNIMRMRNETQSQMEVIQQQTQQQQQQHQETMNSTTTEAESEATSFFGDFEDQDFGGLSAIVTAPLNTIRSLLNSTCTNLVLPLPFVNKNLTLPCMNSIYTEHFGLFFTLYQTIILAIISYRCIRSIFYDIHGFTNPDDDRIEVMDL